MHQDKIIPSVNDVISLNISFYDHFANDFEKIPFDKMITDLFTLYSEKCRGKKVLDIGSGPGVLAAWIKERGFSVLCLDPSQEMCRRCRQKGLKAQNASIEAFETKEQFDQILAISSLIHVLPEKMPEVLKKIEGLLSGSGVVILSFLLGEDSRLDDPTNAGKMRYFSKFSKEEVNQLISRDFQVLEEKEVAVKKMSCNFLILVLQRK